MIICSSITAQRTIGIHFLYGSVPKKEHPEETKWFGGKLGGHVGVEYDSNKVVSLVPRGGFHLVKSKTDRKSAFITQSINGFYGTFGGVKQEMKRAVVYLNISKNQAQKLDSLINAYTKNVPYDYAFIGMRCAAATYDILSVIDITSKYSYEKIVMKYFYPKKLRKKIFKIAKRNGWQVIKNKGTDKRKWERG